MPTLPTWPVREEYDRAVQQQSENLQDADLKRGSLYKHMGNPKRYGGAGLYVVIYRIDNWLVRCFCSTVSLRGAVQNPPDRIERRYQAIATAIESNCVNVSALTPITYLERGICAGGQWRPCIKMPFLEDAVTLGNYLSEQHTNAGAMNQLGLAWLTMIRQMEAANIAHGDLDITNVLVIQPYPGVVPQLKLIDYDNMWVPQLAGWPQTEYGHEAFQHPAFLRPRQRPYSQDMDRFSALVIYTCIRALELQPSLYAGSDESERLLFTQEDYANPTLTTSNLMVTRKRCGQPIEPYIDEICRCLEAGTMPSSLDDINIRTRQTSGFGIPGKRTGIPRLAKPVDDTLVTVGNPIQPALPATQSGIQIPAPVHQASYTPRALVQSRSSTSSISSTPKRSNTGIGVTIAGVVGIAIVVVVLLILFVH